VWQNITRAGITLAPDEVADSGVTHTKQFSYFILGEIAAFVCLYDFAAEVIRVWFHSLDCHRIGR
jgi:hypothetical protein